MISGRLVLGYCRIYTPKNKYGTDEFSHKTDYKLATILFDSSKNRTKIAPVKMSNSILLISTKI
jgi:hypothetical protein